MGRFAQARPRRPFAEVFPRLRLRAGRRRFRPACLPRTWACLSHAFRFAQPVLRFGLSRVPLSFRSGPAHRPGVAHVGVVADAKGLAQYCLQQRDLAGDRHACSNRVERHGRLERGVAQDDVAHLGGHRRGGAARRARPIADRRQFCKQADPDGEAAPAELAFEQQPIGGRHRFEEGHEAANEIPPAFLRQGRKLQDARQVLHQPHQRVLGEDFAAREMSGQRVQNLLYGFAALQGGQQR